MGKNYFLTAFSFFIISLSFFALNHSGLKNTIKTDSLKGLKKTKISLPPSATISGTTQVCRNDTQPQITFTGSGGYAPYTFTYNIGGPDLTVTSTGDIATVDASTNNVGSVTYQLVSVRDSSNDTSPANGTATVTVSEPTVDFTFNNNGACSGTSVNFTSNTTGDGPFTYSWNFGSGTPKTNANPSHTFISLGCGFQNVNVTLTVTDTNGCSNSVTKAVSIQQKPRLEFEDIDSAFDPFNNCGNNTTDPSYTINVGISSVSTACINSYDVNWGDGSAIETNVTFPATHTYTQLGSFNMDITGRGNNCDNTVTYLIKNSSNPTGSIVNPGNTVNLCIPVSPIDFAIGSWGTNPPDTMYEVDFGDGVLENYTQAQLESSAYYNTADPANSQNFPIPHIYTQSSCPNSYTVQLNISTSCGQTNLTAGPIIILRKPEVDFENPPISCVNSSVQFNNTSTGGYSNDCNVNDGYFWDFGDSTTSTLRDPSHVYTTPGTYTVSLYAQNSCGTTNTITKSICIEPQITAAFTLNTNNGCAPLAVQTTNTTDLSSGCGSETYLWEVAYVSGFCGTAPATWNFTNGTDENSAAPRINFVTAGTYTLSLTTTNSCGSNTVSETIEVKRPPIANIDPIADFCGAASINPVANVVSCAPASETLTYSWSFPGGTPSTSTALNPGTINYTTPGNYQVTFSVTSSCSTTIDTEDFIINPIPTITNTNLTQTICSGTNTTQVVLTSDIAGTTYNWTATALAGVTGFTAFDNTSTIPVQTIFNSNNTSEDVTFTITPSVGGCSGIPVNLVITVDPAPSFTNQPQPETICLNGPINQLSVVVNGPGTPTYQWYSNTVNNNTTGTIITGETAATYTPPNTPVGITFYYCVASFTSGSGCDEITSDTARIEIVNGIQIDTNPITSQNTCIGGDVNTALSVVHSGGTGVITYQWYSNTTNSNTGGTIITGANNSSYTPPTFTVSGNYYYYVIITPDGSGCSPITSNTSEVIVVDDPAIATQPIASQTLCEGTASQDLQVAATGGSGTTYNYQWYSNTTNSNSGGTLITGATNATFTPPTTTVGILYYYCIITQPYPGCSVVSNTSGVIVNQAPSFSSHPLSETICFGETFNTLSVAYSNGVGTPTYQWYSNTVANNTTGSILTGETASTYSVPSGTIGTVYYYAIITFSSGGCTQITSQTAQLTVNQTPNISNKSLTICSGVSFNIIPDSSGGDTVPAGTQYTWTTPVINPTGTISGATNQTTPQSNISQTPINNTANPATVTYTVTPVSGNCTGTDFTITVTVNPSISITRNLTNSRCYLSNTGAIEITISGGIPFSTGTPYLISWTGPNGYTNSDEDISNLEPGIYTVTINDEGGCPFTDTFTILEPEELIFSSISFNPETISCFGADDGTINIDIHGGTIPYTYNWTRNGSSFSNVEDLSNLGPGDYQVTVTDANNCTPIVQNFQIIEPPALNASLVNQVDIICFGDATGAININTTGGRPIEVSPGVFDYSYSWTGPNGYTSNLQNLSGLFAGTYNLTVTDKSNCTDTLQVILDQSDEIIIDFSTTEIECYGDNNASITIDNISGGNPPYTIQWSNLGSGSDQNNLSAGTYIITITDNTNCEKQATVVIDEAPEFSINPTIANVSCYGENDASIALNLVGGITPLTLVWNDDASAGVERNNLTPGTYSVTITDATPCIITETFTISEPDPLELSAVTTDALDCDNANSGAINLIVTGGTLPLSYSWSNGETTEDLDDIPPGTYSVAITDANGCEISENWTVSRFDPLTIEVDTITDFDCITRNVEQTFVARVTGGIPPYQISWSSGTVSGSNNEIMNTNQDGLTIVDVTDSFGCSTSFSHHVDIPILGDANFELNSIGYTSFGIYSKKDPIQFTNTAIGDYISVLWDFGDGNFSSEENPLHTYITEGDYIITQTVTYPFGCVYEKIITLSIEKGYSLMMPNAFTPNNDNINDFFNPAFVGLNNMVLDIYDTWGSLIYSEKGDDIDGWNGKVKDADAENGNYYFKFSAETFYGETITKEGPVVLIK
ncbi:PKD domain-containing protein [Flavivirga spongiicola]|uniref:PKD domain-containing protein n=1 Tax=Flavivirga spongiicola TaxID=421621 RepID=A0ABU7XX43_9FLAO|nr:PKD domain-containing protein [Flavivirga sp. MEBiC05379]MDO5980332.1 PKD domain-containing protein [Flavivirga sp. MEBiC05379]